MTLQLPKNKSNSKKWCIPVVTLNTWYIYTWQKTTFFPQIFNGQLRLKLIFKAFMARLSVASIYHTISKLPPTCNLSNGRGLYWWHVMRFWQHLSKDKKIKITKYIQVYYEKAESNLFKTDGLRRLWFTCHKKYTGNPPITWIYFLIYFFFIWQRPCFAVSLSLYLLICSPKFWSEKRMNGTQ